MSNAWPYEEDEAVRAERDALREEVAQLRAAQSPAPPVAPQVTAEQDADYRQRINQAKDQAEVMAIFAERQQAQTVAPDYESLEAKRQDVLQRIINAQSGEEATRIAQDWENSADRFSWEDAVGRAGR